MDSKKQVEGINNLLEEEGETDCNHNWQRRRDGRRCANCGRIDFGVFDLEEPCSTKH